MKLFDYQKKIPERVALFDLDGDSRAEIAGVLRGYFAKFPANVTIDEYDRWQDLAYACIEQPYDMAFVSVRNMKGVEAARRVRDHSEETALIYISATDEYATEAWQQQAIHYTLKPVEPDQIDQAVQRYTLRELAKLTPGTLRTRRGSEGKRTDTSTIRES